MKRRGHMALWAAGGVSVLTVGAGGVLLASPAKAAPAPGVGDSYAQSIQATPEEGSLDVGVILGEAIAGHTNDVAKAQSQGLDETAVGESLQGYNCGQPPSAQQKELVSQPLQAETGQSGASQGFTVTPTEGASQSQLVPPSFGSTEFAQATQAPYGEADTSYGSISVPGAPFTVSGTSSKAWSGIVGGQREAGATEDIGSVSLLGGVVQLQGLHWNVLYPSGSSARPSASFTIGHVAVAGRAVPTQNPAAAVAAVNAVIGNLGMKLSLPAVTDQQGIESVSALELDVVPNSNRDGVLDPIVNGAQPITDPVEGGLENGFSPSEPSQIEQELCQSDTPITVADVALASVDGAGSFVLSFGGVQATSGSVPANPYNLSLPALALGSSTNQFVPGQVAVAGTPATAGSAGSGDGAGSPAVTSGASPPPGSSGVSGSPSQAEDIAATGLAAGGPLLAIGLGSLGALLLLAEGDRRLMRRAQRGAASFDPED